MAGNIWTLLIYDFNFLTLASGLYRARKCLQKGLSLHTKHVFARQLRI
jgi:hypothetical protein